MEHLINGAAKRAEHDFVGWAIAYTNVNGAIRQGYLGKVETREFGRVKLSSAVEFISVMQDHGGGRLMRVRAAEPIEFTAGITTLEVSPVAFVALDKLTKEDAEAFAALIDEANKKRAGLSRGRPLIEPATKLPPISGRS